MIMRYNEKNYCNKRRVFSMPFCKHCGKEYFEGASFCGGCGKNPAGSDNLYDPYASTKPKKSKLAAGLLGILIGALGVHNFYLGYIGKGIAQLVLSVVLPLVSCGILWFTPIAAWVWSLIEGIMILTGSVNCDASGNPLGD